MASALSLCEGQFLTAGVILAVKPGGSLCNWTIMMLWPVEIMQLLDWKVAISGCDAHK